MVDYRYRPPGTPDNGNSDDLPPHEPNNGDPAEASIQVERFTRTFEASARRWELVVYPSLVAFIILAAYGFYLIYNLSRDVSILVGTIATMTESVDKNMNIISDNMVEMAYKMDSMRSIDRSVESVSVQMADMSQNLALVEDNMRTVRSEMQRIRQTTGTMASSISQIGVDIWGLSRGVSGPVNLFNSFFPFAVSNTPYLGPPPQAVNPNQMQSVRVQGQRRVNPANARSLMSQAPPPPLQPFMIAAASAQRAQDSGERR